MRTRPELILLQKTMVVVEGVARSLDPQLDMWATADPVVRDWIERNLGPLGQARGPRRGAVDAGKALGDAARRCSDGPARLAEQLEEHHAQRVRAVARSDRGDRPGRGAARRWGNAALWVIAALLRSYG